MKLKENMAELIFQRKKFEKRLEDLSGEKVLLEQDLETAAYQDRDDLAMKLMERLEQVSADVYDATNNLNLIKEEIETAKTVETELKSQIEKSESQIAVLISRMESVKLREQLQTHFSRLHSEITQMKPGFSQIEEQIMKLESKLETIQEPKVYWKSEVKEMRAQRRDHRRQAKLVEFKQKLKRKQLPGRVIPTVTAVHH